MDVEGIPPFTGVWDTPAIAHTARAWDVPGILTIVGGLDIQEIVDRVVALEHVSS